MFPDINTADKDGLLALSRELTTEMLIEAYSNGIFPWPMDDSGIIPWFSPPMRNVLFLKDFRISKSLEKERRKKQYIFKINKNFSKVIELCAAPPTRSDGTWITDEMISAYIELHKEGYAHSIECYENEELVGGLYGVSVGKMFAGESMFHLKTNTSKLSLCFLAEHLKGKGIEWLDCQQETPLFTQFGAKEIPRKEFSVLLKDALMDKTKLF